MKRVIGLGAALALGLVASPLIQNAAKQLFPGNLEAVRAGEILEGFKATNRLTVFRAYITALTETPDDGWIFHSKQVLITPGFVNYYVDLDAMKASDIVIEGDTLTVHLPRIMIERPNIDSKAIKKINQGALTVFASQSDALEAANKTKAYDQLVGKARAPFLLDAARTQAQVAFAANARAVLLAKGVPDMKIKVEVAP